MCADMGALSEKLEDIMRKPDVNFEDIVVALESGSAERSFNILSVVEFKSENSTVGRMFGANPIAFRAVRARG